MLDDIKKILEVSKRGIVVMENGKPSYVVVPFDDYARSLKTPESERILERDGRGFEDIGDFENYGMDSIDKMIEKELERERSENEPAKKGEFKERFRVDYEVERIKKDLREVRLEDLPF
ncbi:hypothetical protein HY249_00665 [Candidatus Azambacteria bacterium]|nr:hypothetical protein [Candidatus Azambacteria bacterium]